MLTEERRNAILQLVNSNGSIRVTDIKNQLNISESTARRDITALAALGKLEKVFGGAISISNIVSTAEPTFAQKINLFKDEKELIAKYAATLITPSDIVFIDGGTTTLALIKYLSKEAGTAGFVTNGVAHGQLLGSMGKRAVLIGGELKSTTDAVVGTSAVKMIQHFHFTKGFFGTNGIAKQAGFTTPDTSEAFTKQTAMEQCQNCYILSDSSKFGIVSSVTFGKISSAQIITENIPEQFKDLSNIYKV